MAVLKCKMCGGELILTEGARVATCEYCNARQTLPRLDDERKANLYDRANHFRRGNEFDKAMAIYEQILTEDSTDSETYWSLVLCRYGIEYVEDPATHKRVPTINRAQFTSIFDDENYRSALQYADVSQKGIYEQEAQVINEIQKGILAISQKEEPFDVFICYKETDNAGRRTPDSVLANDLYHQLTQEGFKVFFARITLEDKLGSAYEPYIFAALNSAKVMVVLGTKPEHFNAVWVKNEWSRYLSLIKGGDKKLLIPAYRDMDPYDLPEEFSHLQAQDMGKLGFMQDLIRGIKKILDVDKKPEPPRIVRETVVQQQSAVSSNVTALLERGNMALEDGEWEKADGFYEEVLNQNAKCAEAYLGKFLAEQKKKDLNSWRGSMVFSFKQLCAGGKTVQICEDQRHIVAAMEKYVVAGYLKAEQIRKCYDYDRTYTIRAEAAAQMMEGTIVAIERNKLFVRAKEFASAELAKKISDAQQGIADDMAAHVEELRKQDLAEKEKVEANYAAHLKQADRQAEQLRDAALKKKAADEEGKEAIYQAACKLEETAENSEDCSKSMKQFFKIIDYKDSRDHIKLLEKKQHDYMAAAAKRKKKILLISGAALCAVIAVILVVTLVIIPAGKYDKAMALMEDGKYQEAYVQFMECGTYKDASEKMAEIRQSMLRRQTIVAGVNHTVGLKSDGTVVAVGSNLYHQCEVDDWADIVEITAGDYYTVGLKSDGTVVVAGDKNDNNFSGIENWTDIRLPE